MATYRRHSLLKRNPALSRAEFSQHYEAVHGPLAAGLEGFRKFTAAYLQNHVEGDAEAPFDGVTMTTQVPRDDYTKGFFNHPDYAVVQPDERYLFDITQTVSLLGVEEVTRAGAATRWKALALGAAEGPDDAVRVVRNRLDPSSASALGFGAGQIDAAELWEFWFETETARAEWLGAGDAGGVAVPVREVLIFGPDAARKTV